MQKVFQQTDRLSQASHPNNGVLWTAASSNSNNPRQAWVWTRPLDDLSSTQGFDVFYSVENQTNVFGNGGLGTGSSMGRMARGTSAPGAPNSHQNTQFFSQPISNRLPMARRHSHSNPSPEFPVFDKPGSRHSLTVPTSCGEPHLRRNSPRIFDPGLTTGHQNLQYCVTYPFPDPAPAQPIVQSTTPQSHLFTGGYLPSATTLETPASAGQWSYENLVGLTEQHEALNKSSLHSSIAPNTPTTSELTMASTAPSDMSRQSSNPAPLLGDSLGFACSQPSMLSVPVTSSSFICGEFPPQSQSSSSVLANGSAVSLTDDECFHSVTVANSNVGHDDFSFSFVTFPMSSGCSHEGVDHVSEDLDFSVVSSNVNSVVCPSSLVPIPATSPLTEKPQKARPIAPKLPQHEATFPQTSAKSTQPASPQRGTKRAISKAPYVRRVQPKKMCRQCKDHPEGFRGDHELRRHEKRAHSKVRSMWICVDTSADQTFLAHCKACRSGKKYAADYNAAAHLRRTHFNARKRGYGRGKTNQKRGGMGGGDQPPMEELRKWMKEVEEISTDNLKDEIESDIEYEDDDDDDDDDDDYDYSVDVEASVSPPSSTLPPSHTSGGNVPSAMAFDHLNTVFGFEANTLSSSSSQSQQLPHVPLRAADPSSYSASVLYNHDLSTTNHSTTSLGQQPVHGFFNSFHMASINFQ